MSNDLSAFNAQAWSKLLIANLNQINVMLALVNRDWEGDLQNVGDTVQVRTLGSVSMRPYTKGTPITYEDLAPTKEAMTVSDAQYFAFEVEDVDTAQTDLDTLQLYTSRAAVSMNDKIEAKLLSNYAGAHTDNKITGASSAAIALDKDNVYDYFVKARGVLSKKNVPLVGRWAVVDPDTVSLLLNSPKFVNATVLGGNIAAEGTLNGATAGANRPGFIGRIAGFDVFESNAVPVASSAKYLQFGDKYAIAYAAQLQKMETIRLQTQFASAVRGILLHDTKVFAEASKRFGYIKAVA